MRYLLVGNGSSPNIANQAKHADTIIQINNCKHAASIPSGKTSYVFIANAGEQHDFAEIDGAFYIAARNPPFYRLKAGLIRLRSEWYARNFHPFEIRGRCVSFGFTCWLEALFLRHGMRYNLMPSTGAIAYYWLKRRLKRGDSLDLAGFTFEGWDRHPWHIERSLLKGIYPPYYRDDPSYEKRIAF